MTPEVSGQDITEGDGFFNVKPEASRERGMPSRRPQSRSSEEEDTDLLRAAHVQHEKLMHALQQAEEQLKAQASTIEEEAPDETSSLEQLEARGTKRAKQELSA
eukprot:g3762.t1